ncbi:MAG: alpha/beta hydrolase family protein [Corynebacterium sp.]|uniref:alpha/beta hydrolase n=1 Tax=Corynebacterium sp. TaxID=1720 RepID=UPI0026DC5041|nr:alpha/beta hydrolase family protein [Corynebacterium sp.]MDO5099676.1 alpha/beta hydrolase family protein [Corynebacterium sp.]
MNENPGATRRYCNIVAAFTNAPISGAIIKAGIATVQQFPSIWRRIPPIYLDERARPASGAMRFSAPRLIDRMPDENPRVQRWFIESPAMQRIVEVQVMLPTRLGEPAPMLYLLDGVSAPRRSGWLREGDLLETMGDKQVTVVMPTEASGSLYEDWLYDDPILGRCQWETFLTQELPPILENPDQGLAFNGKRIIGGLSMGATGAVRIAARNPEFFHGVIGLSGCYSTTSTMGRGMTLAMIRSVGGEPDNIWGKGRTQRSIAADVTRNPEGLRNMPVYLFTANGHITNHDIGLHLGRPRYELPGAVLLEHAAYVSTKELEAAMRRAGMTHQVVKYQIGGVHDWAYYGSELLNGWEAVYVRHHSRVR